MPDDEIRTELRAAADAATRAAGFARAALIVAVMALAIGVLGLGLPIR